MVGRMGGKLACCWGGKDFHSVPCTPRPPGLSPPPKPRVGRPGRRQVPGAGGMRVGGEGAGGD